MDLERFRLRRFLESLGPDELQKVETPMALADVAGILEGNAKAVWFGAAGPEHASLAGNVAGSRSRLAHAFGTTPQRLLQEVLSRLKARPEIVEVSNAPCQELVEKDPDLTPCRCICSTDWTARRTSPRRPISPSTGRAAG